MSTRKLYIAAYDISNPRRLRQALKILKGYACGRQKSVFECYLTPAEYWRLIKEMRALLDETEDRFLLIRHDPRRYCQICCSTAETADTKGIKIL